MLVLTELASNNMGDIYLNLRKKTVKERSLYSQLLKNLVKSTEGTQTENKYPMLSHT